MKTIFAIDFWRQQHEWRDIVLVTFQIWRDVEIIGHISPTVFKLTAAIRIMVAEPASKPYAAVKII